MSYIGLPPKTNFSSGLLDRFTGLTTNTVTLTHDIASENDIVVFYNNVKQDSNTYSVGGTGNKTLTLGGTLVSADVVEVHYLNIVGQTLAPSSGSVGNDQVTSSIINSQTAETSIAGGDEVLIYDTSASALRKMTRTNFVSGVGGNNTPSFMAKVSSAQSISHATSTIIQFDQERFDTDSAYDHTTNYRFTVPTGKGGKYFLTALVSLTNFATNKPVNIEIRKNGSGFGAYQQIAGNYSDDVAATVSQVFDASAGDYFDCRVFHRGDSSFNTNSNTMFGGFKLI